MPQANTIEHYDGAAEIERAWREGLMPDPLLTVSEWSDRHRMLSSKASAEPGRWRTSRTPYLKAIMDCLSPTSPVERVVFMKAAQLGATEMGSNWIGYKLWQDGQALRSDMRAGFPFAGVTFEEYAGEASTADGNGGWVSKRFIDEGEAHAFPLGTIDSFATYFAPADFNETVNTLGQPIYAKQEPRRFDRGTDLHTQSNPLPICQRPGLLVKLTAS